MSVSASQSLPEYGSPPVDEVVCGVLFEPIKAFLLPHFGLLWEKFKPEYPNCQEVPPLMPTIESFEEFPPAEIEIPEIPLPRVWFLYDDGRIIQVQRDRFLHNWRKLRPTDEYPRYRKVFHMFQTHLSTFQEFLNELRLGTVTPRQYEMTYVNLIPQGEGWTTTFVLFYYPALEGELESNPETKAGPSSITYGHHPYEFGRSQSSSLSRTVEPRRGQRISLRDARQIALQTLAETERRLEEERAAEARFLLSSWEDENSSA